jgi:Ca-activated chloride channel family protein
MVESRELSPVRLGDAKTGTFLAVRGVVAEAAVDGPFARTTIAVTFHNDLGRTLEGDLVFPLPPSAALEGLKATVGKRVVVAKLRPRPRAQAEYARAVAAGKTAALGETEGEDLARLRVAPIEDGEDVKIELVLVHPLLPTDGGHRLVLPLTYMPRYVESEAALKDVERAAVDRPRPLTLAARAQVTVRIESPSGKLADLRCTSHKIHAEIARGETVITVRDAPLDRDLHLEIQDRPRGADPTLWIQHDPGDGPDALGPTTAIAVVPPAHADEGPVVPRTVTFLVDRSGSMDGGPMASAIRAVRGSLRALGPDDRFNVIAFDNTLEVLAPRPVPFADDTLAAADAFISSIHARGGTEASMAMAAALDDNQTRAQAVARPEAPPLDAGHRLRVVVFMTDGDVAGAEQVLKTAREKLVDTRIHVVGIGHSVHHGMLSALAAAGGGAYLPVSTDEDLEQALARLKNAINAPVWTGLKVTLDREGERRSPKQVEPSGPLDLFAGQPLLLSFRGALEPGDRLVLEGQRPGGDDRRLIVDLHGAKSTSPTVAPLVWALLRNRRLTYRFDPADDATLEGLGTTFGLTNRMVALVGVHDDQRGVTVEGTIPVSLPMPAEAAEQMTRAGGYGGPRPAAGAPGGAVRGKMMAYAPQSPPAGPSGFAPPPPMAYGAPPGFGPPPPPPQAPGGYGGPQGMPAAGNYGWQPPAPQGMPGPGAYGAPPPPPARMAAPAAAPAPAKAAPPPQPAYTDDEAGLRALLLSQGAGGLFAGDVGVTLAAVAALVTRGHTHREGGFRSELRRTLGALKGKLAAGGDAGVHAALAAAILLIAAGEEPPAELPDPLKAALTGLSTSDLPAARQAVRAALLAAPASWRSHVLAGEIARVFQLVG